MKFLLGLVLGIILVPLGLYLYLAGGSMPVATTDSDMPFERYIAHKALNARIDRDMPKSVPVPANEANEVAGAEIYKQHCAVCHGVPLAQKTAIATGMYPRPPQLWQGKGVTDDTPGETYWKVFNGIRLSGMPGFSKTLSETQMWQVSLLLANADKLPDSVKSAIVTSTASCAPTSAVPQVNPVPPAPNFPSSMAPK